MILLVIAEDTESRLLIKNQLKSISGITSILESNSVEEALFSILEKEPQVIISSNNLPLRSGFDLAYLLQKINFKTYFIILSDNTDNAIDAIRSKVFDYLVYPFPGERLASAVQKALGEIEKSNQIKIKRSQADDMKIRLSVSNGFTLVDLNLLSHCHADGSYSNLFFTNGKIEFTSYHLGKLEEILRDYQFERVNRSIIVNMRMLRDIDEKKGICSILAGNETLNFKISKMYVKKMVEKHFL